MPVDPFPTVREAAGARPNQPSDDGAGTALPDRNSNEQDGQAHSGQELTAPELGGFPARPDRERTLSNLPLGDVDLPTADDRPHAVDNSPLGPPRFGAAQQRFPVRYQVLRSHARGGLGEVFIARDRELPRDVVLKEIQSQFLDDDKSVERFVLEAEITGSLEHPGIVPIYGFGYYADGRPFYAMRFIRGQNLGAAIRKFHETPRRTEWNRDVEFRDLIQRFCAVCQALEFAHRRGVIHRDLKPSNVMLGEFGETLVVDWGLAKRLGTDDTTDPTSTVKVDPVRKRDSNSSPTASGAVIGTPNYMSPEQAAGALNEVGPASDVYSLGATLYFLLTCRTPMADDDLPTLLAKVQRGDFPSPRQVDPRVPPALNAICLQAMRLLPEHRFRSASALAEDLQRWLADEPVTAFAEPPLVRAGRWIRRHRTLVTTASVSLVIASALAISAAVLLNAARRSEKNARETAEANERRALAAESKAEDRFRQALQAVDDSFTEISENPIWLRQTPGTQELRRRLLERAKDYYERFIREKSDDPQVQAETANAYFRLGQVMDDLSPAAANLEPLEKAAGIWAKLAQANPQDAISRRGRAAALNAIGRIQLQHGRNDDAMKSFTDALQLADSAVLSSSTDLDASLEAADAMSNIGQLHGNAGRIDAAIQSLQSASSRLEHLVDHRPAASDKAARKLGDVLARLAFMLQQQDQLDAAAKTFDRAIAVASELHKANPTDVELAVERGGRILALANLRRYSGQSAAALELTAQATGIFAAATRDSPHVTRYGQLYAKAGAAHALNLMDHQRFEEAKSRLDAAVAVLEKLISEYPTVIEYRSDLAAVSNMIAEYYGRTRRVEQSLGHYERSVTEFAKIFSLQPRHVPAERGLHYAHMNRVTRCLELDKPSEALRFLELRMKASDGSEYERNVCRHWRAYVWAHGPDYERGAAEALALATLPTVNAEQFYNLACVVALAASSAAKDQRLPPTPRAQAADRLALNAMGLLERARAKGFFAMPEGLGDLRKDHDLNSLRNRDDFKQLLKSTAPP